MQFDVGPNVVVIFLALIAAVPGIIAAIAALQAKKQGEINSRKIDANDVTTEATHMAVNGRMDELLLMARMAAHAEGKLEGANGDRRMPPVVVVPVTSVEVPAPGAEDTPAG